MFMICWNYCGPFFSWLFIASSFLLLIFASFTMKRGIRRCRKGLRFFSLSLVSLALLKLLTIDTHYMAELIFCDLSKLICFDSAIRIIRLIGGLLIFPAGYGVYKLYNLFINKEERAVKSAIDMNIRFWADFSMLCVVILMLWLTIPWVSYLTIGSAPYFLQNDLWQILGVFCFILILVTFWRYEDCYIKPKTIEDKIATYKVWVPRDTLWLATAFLLITYALLFVSDDVLTNSANF